MEVDDDDDKPEVKEQKLGAKFIEFLNYLVMKVTTLRPGDILMLPGGWRTSDKEGHALMYVLLRESSSFTFAVSNTGDGLDYHPARSEVNPPKLKRALSIVCDKIPVQRLSDSSFWFMLFRPMVYPHETNTGSYIYEILLPYLNQRPVISSVVKQDIPPEYEDWKTPTSGPIRQNLTENPFSAAKGAEVIPTKTDFPQSSSANPFEHESIDSPSLFPSIGIQPQTQTSFSPSPFPQSIPQPIVSTSQSQAIDAASLLGLESMLKSSSPPPGNPLFVGLDASAKIEVKLPAGKTPPKASNLLNKSSSQQQLMPKTFPTVAPTAPLAPIAQSQPVSSSKPPNAAAKGDLLDWGDFSFSTPDTNSQTPQTSGAVDPFGGLDPFANLNTDPTDLASKKKKGPFGHAGPPGETIVAQEEDIICEFRTLPRGGDASYARCVLESIHCGVRILGGSREQSKTVSMLLRYSLVRMIQSDLMIASKADISFADRQLIDRALRNLAHAANKEAIFFTFNSRSILNLATF